MNTKQIEINKSRFIIYLLIPILAGDILFRIVPLSL
jgi:hypothetical protein